MDWIKLLLLFAVVVEVELWIVEPKRAVEEKGEGECCWRVCCCCWEEEGGNG